MMMYFVSQAHPGAHTAFPITCVSLPERTGGSERGTSLLNTAPTYSVTCCSGRGLYFSVVHIYVVGQIPETLIQSFLPFSVAPRFLQERCPVDPKSKEVLQEALHLRISLVSL